MLAISTLEIAIYCVNYLEFAKKENLTDRFENGLLLPSEKSEGQVVTLCDCL